MRFADGQESQRIQRAASFLAAAILLSSGLILIWIWEIRGARHVAANLLGSYLLVWLIALLLSSRRPGELHLRFVLVTASIGLVVIMLEAISLLGLVDYRMLFGVRQRISWLDPWGIFDDELRYRKQPNWKFTGTYKGNIAVRWCLPKAITKDYRYDAQYDSNGFRNDRDLESAPMVVLGDSYIEAMAVTSEATLTGRLSQLSGDAVANLALADYGPQQQLGVLRRFALPLEPEVVVWAFYGGNDLGDMENHELELAAVSSGRLRTRPSLRDLSFTKNAVHALYNLLHECWPSEEAARRFGTYRTASGDELQMYFTNPGRPLQDNELVALDRLADILREAYELTVNNSARFVLLYVPSKYRVYGELVNVPDYSDLNDWRPNDMPARLEEMVRAISPDIGFVDLTHSFVREAASGRLLYFHDDSHWTEEGHLVAAETLWAFLSGWGSAAQAPP